MAGFHFPAKAKAALAQTLGFSSRAEQCALFLQEKESSSPFRMFMLPGMVPYGHPGGG